MTWTWHLTLTILHPFHKESSLSTQIRNPLEPLPSQESMCPAAGTFKIWILNRQMHNLTKDNGVGRLVRGLLAVVHTTVCCSDGVRLSPLV